MSTGTISGVGSSGNHSDVDTSSSAAAATAAAVAATTITFVSKDDYEIGDDLVKLRNEQRPTMRRSKTYDLMWHAIDLSPKLFTDQAAANKKQDYRASRSVNVANAKMRRELNEAMRRRRIDAANSKFMDVANMLSSSGATDSSRIAAAAADTSASADGANDDKPFQVNFRVLTPNQDRILVARFMELTDKKGTYRNPVPPDFRGVWRDAIFVNCAFN